MAFTRPARGLILGALVGAVLLMGLHPLAARAGVETYVSMGDSYTAGPLIPNQLPDPPGCLRSDHNYPHHVSRCRGSVLRDPSCSGATTRDLSAPQTTDFGVNPPQLDRLDAKVTVVSLQIGGNDIGFSEILQRCAAPVPLGTPCRDIYAPEKELNAMLAAQAAVAGATYVDLYGPSIGHDACQLPGVRWVEPYVPLAPAAPVHPNALGMRRMAGVVAGAMSR